MSDFLFDTPYWFLGLLVVAAIGLFVSGNARQKSRLKVAALVTLLLAVALILISHFVDTDKEKVVKRTRQLIEAVEKKDKATVASLLHSRVSLAWMRKDDIVEKATTVADDFHLSNVRATSIDVEQPNPNEILATVNVSAHIETGGWAGDPPSSWALTWERTHQGWLLVSIKPLKLPGIDLQTLIGRMPH
jgi:hypothetical protein